MSTLTDLVPPARIDAHRALGFAAAALVALAVVPRRLHLSAGAAGAGFDPALAHLLLTVAALACVAAFGVVAWRARGAVERAASPPMTRPPTHLLLGVALLVFATFTLLYFPPFLARWGPYGEDKYFLSVLQRMQVGQQPYTDFEFLYGPLLIYPTAAWMKLFGYSLQSYYMLLALIEATTFAALTVALGIMIPDRRAWLAALAVAVLLLLNDNLGLSWIALRRLLPIVILLLYALRADSHRGWFAVAALLGVQCVMSLEYAAACIIALSGAAAVQAVGVRDVRPLLHAVRIAVAGLVVGGALAFAMMGPRMADWLYATWRIVALRGGGEAAFPFGMSVNAFAVLALLFLACARMGAGLPAVLQAPLRGIAWSPLRAGDRFLLASLAYAVIAAKSGMARSDMYHLVPPVLGLVGVVLLPLPYGAFPGSAALRRMSIAAVALICATYAPGMVGAGRIWAEGLVLGARDVLSGTPSSEFALQRTRAPRIGAERTQMPSLWVDLAAYMAAADRVDRPVLFYERTWGLDRYIGVAKPRGVYPTDDYLVSDEVGMELREFLETNPNALVIIERSAWRSLLGDDDAPAAAPTSMFWFGGRRSVPVRILEYWSSSHFGTAVVEELDRKRERWASTVGTLLRDDYTPVGDFGEVLVLGRRT